MLTIAMPVLGFFLLTVLTVLFLAWKTQPEKAALGRLCCAEFNWKPFGAMLGGFLLLYLLAYFAHLHFTPGIGYFLGGFLLPLGLSSITVPQRWRQMILLLVIMGLTLMQPQMSVVSLGSLSLLWGLIGYQITATLTGATNRLESTDMLPALAWLSGEYWIHLTLADTQIPLYHNLLVSFLGIALLMRELGRMSFKAAFMRYLVPVVAAGLIAWVLTRHILLQANGLSWGGLIMGSLVLLYGIAGFEDGEQDNPLTGVMVLMLMGMGTLAASRLFGTFGWVTLLVLASTVNRSRFVVWAGLFWLARILLQAFIYQYNPNITGINMLHAYASASLYAGVVLVLLLPQFLQSAVPAWKKGLGLVVLSIGAPLLANFFLHAEPSSGFLLSTIVTTVAVVFLTLLRSVGQSVQELMMLMPVQLVLTALVGNDLLEMGLDTTLMVKIIVLVVIAVVFLGSLIFVRRFPLPEMR
jgi:hypothetical protein